MFNKYKDEFLLGRKPITEALERDQKVEKVWIDRTIRGEFEKEIRFLCRSKDIPLITAPVGKLNELVKNSSHQGLVAQLSFVKYHKLENIIPFLYEQGKTPRILLLDGIEDVGNLGALARSALWFNFDAIVVPMKSSARMNGYAMKASMGALLEMMVCREKSILGAVEFLQASGVKVFAACMNGNPINSENFTGPVALVLGSEENGIHQAVELKCDERVAISGQQDKMESLNVSVAGAILMHEVFKTIDE